VYNIQSELKEAVEFFEGGLQLCQQLIYKQLELIRKLSSEVHQLVLGQGDCSDCFLLLLHPLKLGNLSFESSSYHCSLYELYINNLTDLLAIRALSFWI
jgi:hypothetical protein